MKTNNNTTRSVPVRTIAASILIAMLFVALSGCLGLGYNVGSKSLFGQDVKTVFVPIIESSYISRDMGERLTEALCKRIEGRSPYKVVNRSTADSTLSCRIVSSDFYTSLVDRNGDSRQKIGNLVVEVRWVDQRNHDLRQFEQISWNVGSGQVSSTEYLVAEYGQSQLTQEQRQIEKVADLIVGMMEVPW